MGKLNFTRFATLAVMIFSFSFSQDSIAGKKHLKCPSKPGKVVICHVPPGNPENQHIIAVGLGAVDAHLDHGDRLGICLGTEYEDMKQMCGICDTDVDPSC